MNNTMVDSNDNVMAIFDFCLNWFAFRLNCKNKKIPIKITNPMILATEGIMLVAKIIVITAIERVNVQLGFAINNGKVNNALIKINNVKKLKLRIERKWLFTIMMANTNPGPLIRE